MRQSGAENTAESESADRDSSSHVCSSFLEAARIDHFRCVEALLMKRIQRQQQQPGKEEGNAEAGAEIDKIDLEEKSDSSGKNALMYAAELGHLKTVVALLDGGAFVDATSANGHTALMYSAANGHLSCVQELLARKADLHMKAHRGQVTALMLVILSLDTLFPLSIFYDSLRTNFLSVHVYMTSLFQCLIYHVVQFLNRYASRHGYNDVVNLLLDNGAATDARDSANRNALFYSSYFGTHPQTTRLLLKRSGK